MCTGFNHKQVVLLCAVLANAYGLEWNNAEAKDGGGGGGHGGGGAATEFSNHRIITPKLTHFRTKRHIDSTRETDGHVHDITLGLNLGEEDILVDLQLNRNLLPRDYFEKYYHNGSQYIQRPVGEAAGLCHYQGVIRGRPGSWAALSTCNGVSGVVFDGEELHYVERIPETPASIQSPHYHFQHSDIIPRNFSCGYSGKPHPVRDLFHDENFSRLLRYKRSSTVSNSNNIRGPYNANALSRYVELVLVADKSVFEKHGHEVSKIYNRCKDIANIVNALYQPLNIFIALVGVEVWKDEDQVEISTDGDKTLTNFLNYRKVRLIQEHPNDNAQLLTGKQFDAGVVGKALKGPICTYQYSGGVNMDHSDTVGLVATTVAHEMGHNFGMEHDTEEECECPDKRCIMAPSSGSKSPTHWSSCSYEYLALSFERSMDYCLRNKPTRLFDSPVCGNGFVEPGEQCDCGLPDYCNNPCCNAATCMLYSNATCATGHCCDLETCRPKLAGVKCRTAVHECDLPEYCTGDSEYCPDDSFKSDGHECMAGQAFCHNGMCRTHGEQCKLLWGPTGQSSDDRCYMMNTQGNQNGNCGYNWVNDTYNKCSDRDIKCGMLHCMHLNERLEFGMESVSKVSHSFLKSSSGVIPCRVALVDMGLDMVDPGLAPDGAKCGKGKMCVNQRCMPVADLKIGECNCNGHGVCNNNGHCHCDVGYAPPDCLYPGLGGSEDSGPASNPHATNNFVIGMFVFFLGIVPGGLVVLCLVYYTRGNLKLWWETKGRPATSKLPHVDTGKRGSRPPGSLGVEAGGIGRQAEINVTSGIISPRSPTPPSSQGSKSNSPLLNGHATSIMSGDQPDKGNLFSKNLFGKHEGFTLSPLKEKSPPGVKSAGAPPPIPPPPAAVKAVSAASVASAPPAPPTVMSNGPTDNPSVIGWQSKGLYPQVQKASNNTGTGSVTKMSISGPSLQGSTNPAIAPSVSKSALPSRSAPPPPPVTATATLSPAAITTASPAAYANAPQVAIISPSRRAPSLNSRPLSVPDASTLVAQAQEYSCESETESKPQEGDKQSTVARIASFLTKKDKQGSEASQSDVEAGCSNTLPRKAAKIKRESLMQLEISAPMQLHATELPANLVPVRSAPEPPMPSNLKPSQVKANQEETGKPNKVSWAPSVPDDKVKTPSSGDTRSSMRVTWTPSALDSTGKDPTMELQRIGSMREAPVTIRPAIPKFGSMRAPRPKSLPPTRPSEPPPRPPLPMIPGTPESECFYDDCLNIQEGTAPIADIDDDNSPESIYATIDEKTPDKEVPLQEVTYAPPDAVEGKKEKKSIFSFLYNKPKKKPSKEKSTPEEVEPVSEPIYTNLVESPPETEKNLKGTQATSTSGEASSKSSSISPPSPAVGDSNRTSCGSSEDGGLLSEIVSELSNRDDKFVSGLGKNDKKTKIGDTKKTPTSTGQENKKIGFGKSGTSSGETQNKSEKSSIIANNGPSKSSLYPWRANRETARKSSTSTTTSTTSATTNTKPVTTTAKLSDSSVKETSGPTPRGVFSYMNSGGKGNTSESLNKNSVTSAAAPASKTSASIFGGKKTPKSETASPATTTDIKSTSAGSTVPASKSLAASLAAVRAAGAAAGEAAAAAAATGGESSSAKNNKLGENTWNTNKQSGLLKTGPKTEGTPLLTTSVPKPFTKAAVSITTSSVTLPSSTATTAKAGTEATVPTSTSIANVPRLTRPVFPPDKVIFPPDKLVVSSTSTEDKGSSATKDGNEKESILSPTSGSRGRGSVSQSKATTPTGKPGRVLSPTRGTTPTSRGTTPTRNTTATSSGRADKSRSTTPQPGAKKLTTGSSDKVDPKPVSKVEKSEKIGSKPSDKTGNKVSSKPSDKATEKTGPKKQTAKPIQAVGKVPGGPASKPTTGPGTSGPNRAGRISNTHVASLQQKFEKKEAESQDLKPSTKAPSRKSQEVKPILAPKPK